MAYPILQTANTASGADTTSALTKTVTICSGLSSGDLIVLLWHCQDSGGPTTVNISTNLGTFTRALNGQISGSTNKYALFYKWSDGTESGLTATISHSTGAAIGLSGFSCYRITGADQSKAPTFAYAGSTFDPPSVTAPWGGGENLFLAIGSHVQNSVFALTSYPTGYSNGTNFRNSAAALIAQATKQSSAATDDPSAFVMSSTAARTFAITGVVGAGAPPQIDGINDGNPVQVGQTGIRIALSNYLGTPTSVTCTYASGTKTLSVSNITGDNTEIFVDLEDRSEGADYPLLGSTLEFTVTDGVGTDAISTTLAEKSGETALSLQYVVNQYDTFFAYHWEQDNFNVEAAEFVYTTTGFTSNEFTLFPDTSFSSAPSGGVVRGWLRPIVDKVGFTGRVGNVYYYEFTVNNGALEVNRPTLQTPSVFGGNVSNPFSIDFSVSDSEFAATEVTLVNDGVTKVIPVYENTPQAGSVNFYTPAWVDGETVFKFGAPCTVTATDGTTTTAEYTGEFLLYEYPAEFVTLTSVSPFSLDKVEGLNPPWKTGTQVIYDRTKGTVYPDGTYDDLAWDGTAFVSSNFIGTTEIWDRDPDDKIARKGNLILQQGSTNADTNPDTDTFGTVLNSALDTVVPAAKTITLAGMDAGVDALAIPTGGLRYRVSTDGGVTFDLMTSASMNVRNGYVLDAELTSASSVDTTVTGTLTVGTTPFTLSVTTRGVDNTPDTLNFTSVPSSELLTQHTSETRTVTGMDVGETSNFTIVNGTYSKNGGAFVSTAGVMQNGDTFTLRGTSDTYFGRTVNVTLTAANGNVASIYRITNKLDPLLPAGGSSAVAGQFLTGYTL